MWICQQHFMKTVLSPIEWSWHHCCKSLTIYVRMYFWALYSIMLVYISVLMPVQQCFDYCCFVISFEIWKCGASTLFFFKIVLPIQGPLRFHINFRTVTCIYLWSLKYFVGSALWHFYTKSPFEIILFSSSEFSLNGRVWSFKPILGYMVFLKLLGKKWLQSIGFGNDTSFLEKRGETPH